MEQRLLDSIACPKCFGSLEYDAEKHRLLCKTDNLSYAINDNIPVLLEEEAQPFSVAEEYVEGKSTEEACVKVESTKIENAE